MVLLDEILCAQGGVVLHQGVVLLDERLCAQGGVVLHQGVVLLDERLCAQGGVVLLDVRLCGRRHEVIVVVQLRPLWIKENGL